MVFYIGPLEIFILALGLYFIILGSFVMWFIKKYINYNIKVTILEKRQGYGSVVDHDRAKFQTAKDGQISFKFYKNRKVLTKVPNSDLFVAAKGFFSKGGEIFFAKLSEVHFEPLAIHDTWANSPFHVVQNVDDFNSAVQNQILIKLKNKKDTPILQIAAIVLVVLVLIIGGVEMKFMVDSNKKIADSNNAVASALTTQTKVWANACSIPLVDTPPA